MLSPNELKKMEILEAIEGDYMLEQPTFGGDGLILNNVTLIKARYGLFFDYNTYQNGVVDRFISQGGTGISMSASVSGKTLNIKNMIFEGTTRFSTCYLNATTKDYTLTLNLINPVFRIYSDGVITNGMCGKNHTINEKYELDLKVIDTDGNPIQGASVEIKDATDAVVATLTTDSNGNITTQELTAKTYTAGTPLPTYSTYYHYYPDAVAVKTPHTITISKSGYQTKTTIYDMNQKRTEIETLEQAVKWILAEEDGFILNLESENSQNKIKWLKL